MAQAETEREALEAPSSTPAVPKSQNPWLPVIAMVILMPAISMAMAKFVLIPWLKSAIAGSPAIVASAAEGAKGGVETIGKDGKPKEFSVAFENIVVNLSGAKGTRYLKASFTVFSSNPNLPGTVEEHKSELMDVSIGVLSSKTLADLEGGGAQNLVRNDLIENFNQALKSNMVERIFFSEFVIQ